MKFEWDPNKNKANRVKHRVSFEEAQTVFDDKHAITLYDSEHSTDEERFVIIGESADFRELFVCHCYREETTVRIISARKASKAELEIYYGGV